MREWVNASFRKHGLTTRHLKTGWNPWWEMTEKLFARCAKKTINVTWDGIKAIKSHNASSINQQRLCAKGEQLSIRGLCGTQYSLPLPPCTVLLPLLLLPPAPAKSCNFKSRSRPHLWYYIPLPPANARKDGYLLSVSGKACPLAWKKRART
jgi:hypothetical protein